MRLRNLIRVPLLTNIKFEVDEDSACSDQIKFKIFTYVLFYIVEYQFRFSERK